VRPSPTPRTCVNSCPAPRRPTRARPAPRRPARVTLAAPLAHPHAPRPLHRPRPLPLARQAPSRWPRPQRLHPLRPARLTISTTAKVYPTAVFDLEHGPIVIDDHAVIRPGAIIQGRPTSAPTPPSSTTPSSSPTPPSPPLQGRRRGRRHHHSGLLQQGHDGHLGDSWLGEWVNLGAGTTNSNLLNTYAEVIGRALGTSPLGTPPLRGGPLFCPA